MNMKNKLVLGICIVFLLSTISGCGVSDNKKDIYSSMYTDNEKIAQKSENHTHTTYNISNNSDDDIEFQYGGFSGVDTIWILKSKDDEEITLDYDSKVNSGDFKAVLVNPEKEVQDILEGADQGNKTIKLAKGEYRFKLVGNNANGKVKLSIAQNKNVEIESALK
ncbi:hypothetical protein CLOBY_33850 [Clostridium saccharobutylicum]|nr:hypothetical protein [Clostridium saccharobutylicum]AQR91717.1 hypothetical protein CLOSC_34430 [Clostridium saccharobutylicum]AQS01621.1 hypothetical protein CSACC_34500 [Clostridium saccharobutylicum]AQS11231.1 hypothetical protein CLOBY_33850 [Clostridium saccharobutylicum]AQS15604.1 hypothetical protein CLOSACC_34500 [Clostridium saccharobutylicum]MBC2403544.1 hypothetical protein [Clostridium saccharobutylicum]